MDQRQISDEIVELIKKYGSQGKGRDLYTLMSCIIGALAKTKMIKRKRSLYELEMRAINDYGGVISYLAIRTGGEMHGSCKEYEAEEEWYDSEAFCIEDEEELEFNK